MRAAVGESVSAAVGSGRLQLSGGRLVGLFVVSLMALVALQATAPAIATERAGGRPLEFVDLMKFRTVRDPVISEDGAWVAYGLWPDRGDGVAVVRSTERETEYVIERGAEPEISSDGKWVVARVEPPLADRERAARSEASATQRRQDSKGHEEEPKPGLALLSTEDGALVVYERVESFALSGDGRHLALRHVGPKESCASKALPEGAVEVEPESEASRAGESAGSEPARETPHVEPIASSAVEREAPARPVGAGEVTPPKTALETARKGAREAGGSPGEKSSTGESAGCVPVGSGDGKANVGATLVLRELASGREAEIAHVTRYAFSNKGEFLAFATGSEGGEGNGVFLRELRGGGEENDRRLLGEPRGRYTELTWAEGALRLAFVAAVVDDESKPGDGAVWTWDGELRRSVGEQQVPTGWFVPSNNELRWTRDGARLFFGVRRREVGADGPAGPESGESSASESEQAGATQEFDPYDVEALLDRRGLDVWHWNDPLIIPHQKKLWDEERERVYRAVLHFGSGRVVSLADEQIRDVTPVENPHAALGLADTPYLKKITWDGRYNDIYRVSLADGERQLVTRELRSSYSGPEVSLSPGGRFVAFYRTPHWYLFDGQTGGTRCLTDGLPVPFEDEDHDYPDPAPSYGVAGWTADDRTVLIYDKYDIWEFPAAPAADTEKRRRRMRPEEGRAAEDADARPEPLNVTGGFGRSESYVFRLIDLDEDREWIDAGERLLLSAYAERTKQRGFFEARQGESGVRALVDEPRLYSFVARAKNAPALLVTRERYDEFPDLWVTDPDLDGWAKLSDANPQIDEFAWGTAELVEWTSDDGEPLQGVLIRPGDYEPGRRYPVLVYFYRLFSQRLHEFNEPVVNHRPSFPLYASNGYAVFLPDIRFEVGRPGLSAMKCLVPGVKKLIEMGVADPDAVGLHGHSWSGYQTAFVVTQTNLFAAAVAGAPVSNMTSAYSGIRLGTGLARQFQYEQSQSRIGRSLWDGLRLYIENSPVFYADRIETPLLIQFGDRDEAVPWQQGIELYLAMRRLEKPVVFLQYRDEPHHLEKYANKLDYSMKMKEFFDHHLKGAPAPLWMTEGVAFREE